MSKNQFGLMSGMSSTEAIHLMRQLVELHRDRKKILLEHLFLKQVLFVRVLMITNKHN